MADIQTDGQIAPAPTKPKPKHKLGTQGRKPVHRSTKAELNRETLTAQVITALVGGKTFKEISEEFGISEDWINRVKKKLSPEFVEYFASAKTNEISSLIEQGLKAQLKALIKMVEVTEDDVWLKTQRAPELATFFGVVNDKTVRILAAIERADERQRAIEINAERHALPEGTGPRREPQDATQAT